MSHEDDLEDALKGAFGLRKKGLPETNINGKLKEIRRGEVLRLALLGYSIKEIGDELGFSLRTVQRYLHHTETERILEEREMALRKAAFRRVKLQSDKLMGVFIEIATDPKQKGADRIRAAASALDRIGITGGPNVNINVEVGPRLTTGELIARAEQLKHELLKLEADSKKEVVALEAEIIDVTPD